MNNLLFKTAISICFTLNLFGQSNNIKIDIDKNGISDLFSYDDNSIKVLLNGKKHVSILKNKNKKGSLCLNFINLLLNGKMQNLLLVRNKTEIRHFVVSLGILWIINLIMMS